MTGFLILAFLILIAGVVAVPLAARFGLGSVLGYLLAGMAISLVPVPTRASMPFQRTCQSSSFSILFGAKC